jgi:2-amino-4-hydroxy-6-hydroxymethyldihydropteridine diphosphokinase
VVFGLGANLGDRIAALQGAIDLIAPHLADPQVSSVYETAPVGGPEQPDYANAILLGESDATADELLALAQRVEQAWHRTRAVRWGPRTLDVDIVSIDGVTSSDPALTLPHPRAADRGFVLIPWAEADPEATFPDGSLVSALAREAAKRDGAMSVRPLRDVTLVLPVAPR